MASPRALIIAGLFLLVFFTYGGWHFIRSLEPLTWESAPCRILVFKPLDDPKSDHPFSAEVRFNFRWRATEHQGGQLGISGWKDARDQLQQQLRYEKETVTKCYLPEGDPARAVLLRPSPEWGGLIFIIFSSCVGWILYQAHRGRDLPTEELTPKILPVFAIFFGGAGVLMTLMLSIPVWIESLQVRSWTETPATVVWSQHRTHSTGGKNRKTVHRADICYEYEAAGRIWRNNRVLPGNLLPGSSRAAHAMVSAHPPGKRITCHVDPGHPERALLMKSSGMSLAWTLFPLPFLAIGGLFFRGNIRAKHRTNDK